MKKKSRIEMAKEIIARVRKEMDRPRMPESVRNPTRPRAAAADKSAAPFTRGHAFPSSTSTMRPRPRSGEDIRLN
jgi:hypothetical protein